MPKASKDTKQDNPQELNSPSISIQVLSFFFWDIQVQVRSVGTELYGGWPVSSQEPITTILYSFRTVVVHLTVPGILTLVCTAP